MKVILYSNHNSIEPLTYGFSQLGGVITISRRVSSIMCRMSRQYMLWQHMLAIHRRASCVQVPFDLLGQVRVNCIRPWIRTHISRVWGNPTSTKPFSYDQRVFWKAEAIENRKMIDVTPKATAVEGRQSHLQQPPGYTLNSCHTARCHPSPQPFLCLLLL